jgi:hypothetical protein
LNAAARDEHQLVALMRITYEYVLETLDKRSVAPLMDFIYQNMAASSRQLSGVPIACRKGCSHCCNIWVAASAPEVLYVVRSVNRQSLAETQRSVEAAVQQTEGKSFGERGGYGDPMPDARRKPL